MTGVWFSLCTLYTTLYDKVCQWLMTGVWFTLGTLYTTLCDKVCQWLSAILWRSILLVEETRVPGENHRLMTRHEDITMIIMPKKKIHWNWMKNNNVQILKSRSLLIPVKTDNNCIITLCIFLNGLFLVAFIKVSHSDEQ